MARRRTEARSPSTSSRSRSSSASTASSSSTPTTASSSFEEKPEKPESNLTAIATYVYHRAHLALLRAYLAEGNSPDQPGHFIAWLHTRAPVYGYRFGGEWLDIGDRTQLLEADNRYRRRAGLPERDQYSLE